MRSGTPANLLSPWWQGEMCWRTAGRDQQSLTYHVQDLLLNTLPLVVSAGPIVAGTPSMG